MQEDRISAFGGMAGRVLRETHSLPTLFTGVFLGILFLLLSSIFLLVQMPVAFAFFWHVVVAVSLARFALNGYAGEWRGSIISGRGGSWFDTVTVAFRYLILSSVFLLPLVVLGFSGRFRGGKIETLMTGGTGWLIVPAALVLVGMMASPPIFLIIAVSANEIGEVFSAGHWKKQFRKRTGDLLTLYCIYIGGLSTTLFLSLIPVLFGVLRYPRLLFVWVVPAAAFVFGFTITLLGRLCGFFAGEQLTGDVEVRRPAGAATDRSPAPAAGPHIRPQPEEPALAGIAEAAPPVLSEAAAPGKGSRMALLNPREQVDEAWRRFEREPQRAIAYLEELRAGCAPIPQVLHALCLMRQQVGEEDGALALAREALPLCFERGHLYLAADIFAALKKRTGELGFTRQQLLDIARALREKQDWKNAVNAYAVVLRADPNEIRAIKGMLEVGHSLLYQMKSPTEARQVFAYLLNTCTMTSLGDFIRQGLVEAERRMAPPGV
jgi:hypothetical protein